MTNQKKTLRMCSWALSAMAFTTAPAMVVPNLSLNVSGGPTFAPGDTVTVTPDVDTIAALDAINGVQALMHYDNTKLTLTGTIPSTDARADGATTTTDVWSEAVVDGGLCTGGTNAGGVCAFDADCPGGGTCATTGDLTYVVVINAAGVSTFANHSITTFTFIAIAEGTTSFTFRPDVGAVKTKLTRESDNGVILPVKADSGSITLTCGDGNACTTDTLVGSTCQPTPLAINTVCRTVAGTCDIAEVCDGTANPCPADVVEPNTTVCRSSAGECDVAETCDGSSAACPADTFALSGTQCTDATPGDCDDAQCNGSGACDQLFGFELNGTACDDVNACTLTDTCDAFGTCAGVDPANQVTVNMTVDSLVPTASVTRNVTFVITTCGFAPDIRNQLVTFTFGSGTATLAGVDPLAAWISVSEGHTLRRLASVVFDLCGDATVDLIGAASLVSGDFQNLAGTSLQDDVVDVVDFSILASVWNLAIDATLSAGADATADGVQGTADFTSLQTHFLRFSDPTNSCPAGLQGGAGGTRPAGPTFADLVAASTTSLPVDSLRFRGASWADTNGDGVVDVKDIRAFAQRYNLPLLPEFRAKLAAIEEVELVNARHAKKR